MVNKGYYRGNLTKISDISKSNEGVRVNWKSTNSCPAMLKRTVLVAKVVKNWCDYKREGKKWSKMAVGSTFLSLTVLLGGKSLKTINCGLFIS